MLTFVFKTFALSIFEWPLNTGFTGAFGVLGNDIWLKCLQIKLFVLHINEEIRISTEIKKMRINILMALVQGRDRYARARIIYYCFKEISRDKCP